MRLKKLKNNFFNLLMSIGVNKIYYSRIQAMLRVSECLDEMSLRNKAQNLMISAYVRSALLSVLYFVYFRDLLFAGVLYILLLQTFLSSIINVRSIQLGLKTGLEQLDAAYKISESSIELALESATERMDKSVKHNFEQIRSIVACPRDAADKKLQAYTKNAQWILGLLAKTCHYVKRHGDRKREFQNSSFQRILRRLLREVNSDYQSGEHIRVRTGGMGLFIISPIFLIPFIEHYAADLAEKLGLIDTLVYGFYEGIPGQSIKIIILLITLVFYGIYLDIITNSAILAQHVDVLEELLKYKWIRRLTDKITPPKNSPEFRKIRRKIIYSGTQRTVAMHKLRKVLFTVCGLMIGITIVTSGVITKNYRIMHDIGYGVSDEVYQNNVTGILLMNDEDEIALMIREEAFVIKTLAGSKDKSIENAKYLMQKYDHVVQNTATAERLIEKSKKYGLKRKESGLACVMSLIFAALGYIMPDLAINRKTKLFGERLIYEETMRLRTLVMILSEQHTMTVEKALEEMEKSARIFKEILTEINLNYVRRGGVDLIEKVVHDIDYRPFQNLLERLLLADRKMTLRRAFDDLEMNMSFDEDERRDKQKAIAEFNVAQINMFASMGGILTGAGYFILPIIIIGRNQLGALQDYVPNIAK